MGHLCVAVLIPYSADYFLLVPHYDYVTRDSATSRFETACPVFNSLLDIWFSSELSQFC